MSQQKPEKPTKEPSELSKKYPLLAALLNAPPKKVVKHHEYEEPCRPYKNGNGGHDDTDSAGSSSVVNGNRVSSAELQDLVEAMKAPFWKIRK